MFVKRIVIDYVFETVQQLLFKVYDGEEKLTAEEVRNSSFLLDLFR